jgi:hypothetical protein
LLYRFPSAGNSKRLPATEIGVYAAKLGPRCNGKSLQRFMPDQLRIRGKGKKDAAR